VLLCFNFARDMCHPLLCFLSSLRVPSLSPFFFFYLYFS
jgi:hypothetical protein